MKIIITNRFYLYDCSPIIRQELLNHLTIVNPKHTEAIKARRKHYHIPKTVTMFQQHQKGCFSIPRGVENYLNILLDKYAPDAEFDDRTYLEEPGIDFECQITPWEQQFPAIEAGLSTEVNVISLPAGGGKTICALYMIAKRRQPTFILVHTKELMWQWKDRIKEFLNYNCGLVGDGNFNPKDITVGLIRTTINRAKESDYAKKFGYLIVDECHRTSSSTFTQACGLFEPYYLTGLSATPFRKDGLTKFIFFSLGDLVYKLDKKEMIKQGKVLKPTIIKRQTNLFFGESENKLTYAELFNKVKNSEIRNQIIVEDVSKQLKKNYVCCLVLSDHSQHLKKFQDLFDFIGTEYHLLTGSLSKLIRKKTVEQLIQKKVQILLATNSLIGEGFDFSGFTDMFLTSPIASEGRLEQILGRGTRVEKGKKNVNIFDYVDQDPVFQSQWRKRKKFYETY